MKVKALLLLLAVTITPVLYAQEGLSLEEDDRIRGEYNENSIRPIREEDILFKMRVWGWMDLREKMNQPWNSHDSEIVKLMLEGVESGELTAYTYENNYMRDEDVLDPDEVKEMLKRPSQGEELSEEEKKLLEQLGNIDGAEEAVDPGSVHFDYLDIKLLEVTEDFIVDKRRSRTYWDIQSVSILLHASLTREGVVKGVARFRYKDLVEYFNKYPKKAVWYNPQNAGAHLKFSDAFDLRLFNARPIRYSNPTNGRIEEVEGVQGLDAIAASERFKNRLLEFEHNLWEY